MTGCCYVILSGPSDCFPSGSLPESGLAEALREAPTWAGYPSPWRPDLEISSIPTGLSGLCRAFDPSDAGSHSDVHGVSLDDADEVLVSSGSRRRDRSDGLRGREVCAFLRRRYGEVQFTHPLLDVVASSRDEVIEAVLSRDTVYRWPMRPGIARRRDFFAAVPDRSRSFICWREVRRMFPDRMFRGALSASCPTGWSALGRRFRRVGAVEPALPGSVGHMEDLYRYASVIRMCYENR